MTIKFDYKLTDIRNIIISKIFSFCKTDFSKLCDQFTFLEAIKINRKKATDEFSFQIISMKFMTVDTK